MNISELILNLKGSLKDRGIEQTFFLFNLHTVCDPQLEKAKMAKEQTFEQMKRQREQEHK